MNSIGRPHSLSPEDALSIALGNDSWHVRLSTTTIGPISKESRRAYTQSIVPFSDDRGSHGIIEITSDEPSYINLSTDERSAWDGYTVGILYWRLDDDENVPSDDPAIWDLLGPTLKEFPIRSRPVTISAWKANSPLVAEQLWLSSSPKEQISVRGNALNKWTDRELQEAGQALSLIRSRGQQLVGKVAQRRGPPPESPTEKLDRMLTAGRAILDRDDTVSLASLAAERSLSEVRISGILGETPAKNLTGFKRLLGINDNSDKSQA